MRIGELDVSRGVSRMVGGLAMMVCLAAADGALAQGTQEEQDACKPDVFRLCSNYIPNVDAIVDCLKANRQNLNPACRKVMFQSPPPEADKPIPVVKKTRHKVRPRHHE